MRNNLGALDSCCKLEVKFEAKCFSYRYVYGLKCERFESGSFCTYLVCARRQKRKLNLPPSSEVADLTSPPPSLERQTITSGRTAPEESSVKPVTAPVDPVWAQSRFAGPKLIASIPS